MQTILVIDDEPGIRETVRDILQDEEYRVMLAEDAVLGMTLLERELPDLVLLDIWLPRMGGVDALADIKRRWPNLEVVVISGHATIDLAVRTLKLGAFDFIEKPLSIDRLLSTCRNAIEVIVLRKEKKRLRLAKGPASVLIGESGEMETVRGLITQSAVSDARVLITGENGTGKELAARMIHDLSARSEMPFVAVNCAAIPDTLIESELFGHERGAFTDAHSRRIGRFEAADGGTIFLDEVADLSLPAQAKLLRVLQDMRFERLGGEETIAVDARVLAATNKDIAAAIAAGRFREDLYYRLAVVPIRMPALRERPRDVPAIARSFLGKGRSMTDEACEELAARPWPGNVRELRNAVERLKVLCDDEPIGADKVKAILGEPAPRRLSTDLPDRLLDLDIAAARDGFERDYIASKLGEAGYNVGLAAAACGLSTAALQSRMRKLGMEVTR